MSIAMTENELRTAIDADQIFALYQPQVDVTSRRVVAGEVLARWRHPDAGIVSPLEFIPLAERTALIDDIGLRMLQAGWQAAQRWNTPDMHVGVAVNVSPVQLTSERLDEAVSMLVQHTGLPADTLTLEITESHRILDVPGVAARLESLRELGVGISIDDFGVGYSSMERVEELPISEIKIDISMVQDDSDAGYAAFMEIAEYAHDRALRLVAEGVETEAQLERVDRLHCDRAQGWLFGEPLDDAAFERAVRPGPLRGLDD
ncbi:EAL domain-containing protein [Pseudolysinimonas sp.]|uniref:EAL domain-containing protein n=1 Tax=Pseudolysinimonas sp. TaxID=2680009 RepID=UPI003F7D3FD8